MGITGLWEIIGNGEIWSIADYAAQHFEKHQRPLRIAVDEACWRFTNLTPEQVQKIREGEPSANPIEKVILWRILRLLKLNIQLIFVNDGMRRPWKRNKRGGGKLDYELIKLTHQLLDKLKVPYHLAPGEAEAECARMQALGIVDAVWQHKEGGKIVKDHVRVYRAETLLNKYDLDSESLVLIAVLAGGDYKTEGLRGCGPKSAALLARRANGLARSLCHASKNDIPAWRQRLLEVMNRYNKQVEVPPTFPDWKALGHYRSPVVSSGEQIQNLRGLRNGWDQKIDQTKLRVMLRERFNFTTREFMKHISPVFLTRALARALPERRDENMAFEVELKKTRQKKGTDDEVVAKSEVKILFSPLSVTEIDLSQRPPEEDWSKFDGKDGSPYDPTQKLECEVLSAFLRHGLPDGMLETLSEASKRPVKRKRKVDNDDDCDAEPSSQPKQRKRGSTAHHRSPSEDQLSQGRRAGEKTQSSGRTPSSAMHCGDDSPANASVPAATKRPPKQRSRAQNDASSDTAPKKRRKKTAPDPSEANSAIPTSPGPEIPTFRYPRPMPSLPQQKASVVDLCADDSDDEHEVPHPVSSNGSILYPTQPNIIPTVPANASLPSGWIRGEAISLEALRALRVGSRLLQPRVEESLIITETPRPRAAQSSRTVMHEVIDLT